MQLELMTTILTIFLFIGSFGDFVRTQKLRKLAYPLIVVYFLVGIPIIERVLDNKFLEFGYAVIGFAFTVIFIYRDLIITNREKNLMH